MEIVEILKNMVHIVESSMQSTEHAIYENIEQTLKNIMQIAKETIRAIEAIKMKDYIANDCPDSVDDINILDKSPA